MRKQDRNRRLLVGGVALLFLLSTFGFTILLSPTSNSSQNIGTQEFDGFPPTDGPFIPAFPASTIYREPVDERIQVNVLIPYGSYTHPDLYPEIPIERKLGNAWILYNCVDCETEISEMEKLVYDYPGRIYLAPYPNMTSKFVVTTFQNKREMEAFNRTEAEEFICRTLIRTPDICALRFI